MTASEIRIASEKVVTKPKKAEKECLDYTIIGRHCLNRSKHQREERGEIRSLSFLYRSVTALF